MGYAIPTLKTVAGVPIVLISVTIFLTPEASDLSGAIILGVVFLTGLFLVFHGLFTGIEVAVTRAIDGSEVRTDDDREGRDTLS